MDADAQHQQNPIYHTQSSSTYSFFTEQAIPGYPNENFGGVRVGQDMFRGRFEMREAIQRELEKERIREEIIAEEIARKRLLEAEVRNELTMEREMAMRSGGGFSSPFMPLSLPPSHNNLLDPRILHRQPIGLEERIVMSIDEKYGRGGHCREIRGFSVSPFQLLTDLPKITGIPTRLQEDNKKEVIVLGKPNGEPLSGTKRKSTPQVSEGSSQPGSDRSKKKVKEEWSCAICQVSATSERGLNDHLQGKKHQTKEAALVAQKTSANFGLGVAPKKSIVQPIKLALTTISSSSRKKKSKSRKKLVNRTPEMNKTSSRSGLNDMKKKDEMNGENKREKFKFWCEMCQVGAFSEKVMNNHKEGKKHLTHLVELYRNGKIESEASATEKTCEIEDKTETKKAVVVEMVVAEVKTVLEDVTAVVAEENNTMKTGIGEHLCI